MSSSTSPDSAHIAIIGNQLDTLVRFRGPLIRDLVAAGHRVTAVCPPGEADATAVLEGLGAKFAPVRRLSRSGVNPVADLRYLLELVGVFRRIRPTHLFSFFIKPVVYGAIAGAIAGVPRRVGMIEGLGYAFADDEGTRGLRRRLARAFALLMFRFGLPFAHHLVVLNPDDEALFAERGLVGDGRLTRIDGIGVDLDYYAAVPPVEAPVTFTLAARLIREKGVDTFVEAARLLKAERRDVRFLLLGGLDDNPSAISRAEVEAWVAEGVLEWRGHVPDIRLALAETSVFVLPSRYREGLPRSIMEAMAMGRPVITSTAPGCRESVTEGVSGHTAPPNDAVALVKAMERFTASPALVSSMGAAARAEAERRYDVRVANARLMEILLG